MIRRSRALLTVPTLIVPLLVLAPSLRSDGAEAPRWTTSSVLTIVRDPRIDEASGISRSTYPRRVVFLHNDSGDSARFFAVGNGGRTRAVFHVRHVKNHDWEDMSTGPHHTLWFGDIGDNTSSRRSISAVRVKEPRVIASRTLRRTVFRLRYADGPHNAETLLIRPGTGRLYVVTKVAGGGGVYRAPRHLSSHHVNVLHRIASAPSTVTSGDFAPSGRRLVLRNYVQAFFYARLGGATPRVVTLPAQRQGEAIAFSRDGRVVKLASEGIDQPIWRVAR